MSDITTLMMAAAGVGGAEETDANFNQTVLLLHGDSTNGAQNNTFVDSSTNNFTITRNGNTTQGTFSPFSAPDGRWSVSLDGTNDNLSVNVSGIAAGTSTFTLGLWLYLRAFPAVDAPIIDTRSSNSATTTAFQLGILSTGEIKFYDGTVTNLDGFVSLNTWTHIQLVRDSGDTVTLYVNGTATGTTVQCTRNLSDQYFWIGCNPGPVTPRLNAYISNLKWVVGSAIAPTSGGPTSPESTSTSNQQLLACYGNRFIDSNTATTAKAITITGAPKVTPFSPFAPTAAYSPSVNGGSGYFDGNDYIETPTDAAFAMGAGDFTVEGWFYSTSNSQDNWLFDFRTSGSESTTRIYSYINSNVLKVGIGALDDQTVTTVPINSWNHFAMVRSGSGSNNVAVFINGTRETQYTQTTNFSTNTKVRIGARYSILTADYMVGYISSFRVVKGTAVYDPTSTTITVPTTPLTAVSGTSVLTNFTNAAIFDQTGKNILETVGNAQIDTTTKKYGTGSMEFDGTGDYLSIYDPTYQNSVGSGDWTFECWVYFNSLPTGSAPSIVTALYHLKNDSALATTVFILEVTSGGAVSLSTGTSLIASGTAGKITTGSWIHFACVRNNGTIKTYFNGVEDISTANTTTYNGSYVQIGAWRYSSFDSSMDGFIDDLRITKGVARYTTTFTPPTKEFPNL